jgi:hypothetical protein
MFNSFLSPIGSYTQGLQLGDTYGGGTIVYLLQPGDPGYDANQQHGLIFGGFIYDPQDGDYIWPWGIEPQKNVTTSSAIGAGAANTAAIVALYGSGFTRYAAYQASISTYNGFSDWFMPSLNEFKAMIPFGKTLPNWYPIGNSWTSTQLNLSNAYEIYNNQTNEGNYDKNGGMRVALTRSF